MSTLSQQVQNQLKVSAKVVASERTHAGQIAQALSDKSAQVPGGTKVEAKVYETVILTMAAGLEHAVEELRQKELAYTAEQADDVPVRKAREEVLDKGLKLMTGLRATVDNVLGREGLQSYGLSGETVRVPTKLANHMQNVAQLLKKSPGAIKTAFGVLFDTGEAAASIEALQQELKDKIADDDREVRELDDALARRNRAVAAWVEVYQGTATSLEGLYRLAGWKELAERVRPTQRTIRGEDAGPEMEPSTEDKGKPSTEDKGKPSTEDKGNG